MENVQQPMEEKKECASMTTVIMALFYSLVAIVCAMSISLMSDTLDYFAIPKILLCLGAGAMGILTAVKNCKKEPKGVFLPALIVSGISVLLALVSFIVWVIQAISALD